MARAYAQVKVSIWDDDNDFGRLSAHAKLLYIHLISRRDLSLAGHLFVRTQRWADACFGGNVDQVTDAMNDLMTHWYVIVDLKTGEMLIRTFIRHDGGYRNSKMRKAIEGAIGKIESAALSTVATDALTRCVNGEPEPAKDQVEGQPDAQSDEVSDPTCSLRPAALDLQPATCNLQRGQVSDTSTSVDTPATGGESDVRQTQAVAAYARIALEHANGITNPEAYRRTAMQTARAHPDLTRYLTRWPTAPPDAIAAWLHGDKHSMAYFPDTEDAAPVLTEVFMPMPPGIKRSRKPVE